MYRDCRQKHIDFDDKWIININFKCIDGTNMRSMDYPRIYSTEEVYELKNAGFLKAYHIVQKYRAKKPKEPR